MPNRIWTPDELRILREMREAGTPVPVIAAALGRPRAATHNRALQLGIVMQPKRPATDAERARIREMVALPEPPTDEAMAAELGRTMGSVRHLLQEMGLVGARDPGAIRTRRATFSKAAVERREASKAVTAARRAVERAAIDARAAERATRREAKEAARAAARLAAETRRAARAEADAAAATERAERRLRARAPAARRVRASRPNRVRPVRAPVVRTPVVRTPVVRTPVVRTAPAARPAPTDIVRTIAAVPVAAAAAIPRDADAIRLERLAMIRAVAERRNAAGMGARPKAAPVRRFAGATLEDDEVPLGILDVADAVELPGMRAGVLEDA